MNEKKAPPKIISSTPLKISIPRNIKKDSLIQNHPKKKPEKLAHPHKNITEILR
jgi:hypothetical protein